MVQTRNVIKIGRPGYKVTKARDLTSNQRSLLFEVDYPEAEDGAQPRHRFMSAYEQKVEAPDKGYQVRLTFRAQKKIERQTIKIGSSGRYFTFHHVSHTFLWPDECDKRRRAAPL